MAETESVLPPQMIAGVEIEREQPSLTYSYNPNTNRIAGMVDGAEAVGQWIRHAITCERFANVVYSPQFGSEIYTLIAAKEISQQYMASEIDRMVRDALSVDSRITGISAIEVTFGDADQAYISFTASTIYGAVHIDEVLKSV